MIFHSAITNTELRIKIRQSKISVGGNRKLKIFGTLHCKSGKRMKKENRVFFISEKQAIKNDYRSCGHCMKSEYSQWKSAD